MEPPDSKGRADLRCFVRSCIKFGDFVLVSGMKSDYYVDVKELITEPAPLELLGKEIGVWCSGYTALAGVELGAVPLVVSTALYSNKPYVMIRKEKKGHGTGLEYVGRIEGKHFCVIEELTTTGESALRACGIIRKNGGSVGRVITVVDREEGAADLLGKNSIELIRLFRIGEFRDGSLSI